MGINTFKYHVFAPMGRFQLESIYLYFPPGTTVENKGKLILNEIYRLNLNYKVRFHLIIISINVENWVDSAQDRYYWKTLVNAALNLRVP